MILVLLTLMSDQPLVHEGGRLGGRQSGRKCGDVDDYLSDHGNPFSQKIARFRKNNLDVKAEQNSFLPT